MVQPDRVPPHRQGVQSVLAGLLGLAGAVLLLALTKAQEAFGTSDGASAPPVCSAWHRGQGDSHPIDLERMKRGYQELKERLSRSLTATMSRRMDAVSLKGYDAGLPACRRSEKRGFRPDGRLPAEFLGKKLWFTRIEGRGQAVLPDLVRNDPGAIVFALEVERIESLEEASKTFGCPVSLAPRELPQALGVRCVPALVFISKEGEVQVSENAHENP